MKLRKYYVGMNMIETYFNYVYERISESLSVCVIRIHYYTSIVSDIFLVNIQY